MPLPLHPAYGIASHIRDALAPMCAQIEIAGSIRRARPFVNDIDLVVLPKPDQMQAIKDRCLRTCSPVQDGDSNFIVRLPLKLEPIQIDIFFAQPDRKDLFETIPSNWGSVLLCRTGSKEHNVYLCQLAHDLDLKWETMRGLVDVTGKVLASRTEQEIFELLGLEFLPPVARER